MIRLRTPDDLDACVTALREVHDADAYPLIWPADPRAWLCPPGLAAAWVAQGPGRVIVGHAAVVGCELTRLFVTPAARGHRVASHLIAQARAWAGQPLTLQVVDGNDAVGFYEATGWRHLATTRADWTEPSGETVYLRTYRQA